MVLPFQEYKRSVDWELKPDFSANELDWDDDPEKIPLDFNYKSFIDGLEDFEYADKGGDLREDADNATDFNLMEENTDNSKNKTIAVKRCDHACFL